MEGFVRGRGRAPSLAGGNQTAAAPDALPKVVISWIEYDTLLSYCFLYNKKTGGDE
jgi:hypothetical protein